VREVEGTAFGQTLLLSVYEKLSSGSPIEEILSLLDRIEATISSEQREEAHHYEPLAADCKAKLGGLKREVDELEAVIATERDCELDGSAKLRALVEDASREIEKLDVEKSRREGEVEATLAKREEAHQKLEEKTSQHGEALTAVDRIVEIIDQVKQQKAMVEALHAQYTSLLEVASRASSKAGAMVQAARHGFEGEDVGVVTDLLSQLRAHLQSSIDEFRNEHRGEVDDWDKVLEAQQHSLGAVEEQLKELRARRDGAKARLAGLAVARTTCLEHVKQAKAKLGPKKEMYESISHSCADQEGAFARERGRRSAELEIIDRVRAIILEKLDNMGAFLRQRVQHLMASSTGATGGEEGEQEAPKSELAKAMTGATGAAALEALEQLDAQREPEVPEGALPLMPAERYTGTLKAEEEEAHAGTGAAAEAEVSGSAQGSASSSEGGPAAAVERNAQYAYEDELDYSAPEASTGATGAEGACSWAYAGLHGPDFWGELCHGRWASCKAAPDLAQSPIDLEDRAARIVDGPSLPATYENVHGPELENTGNALEVRGHFGSLQVDGDLLRATKIEFHAMSEHTVDGRHAHVEMQIFHEGEDRDGRKRLAVVSVLVDKAVEGQKDSGLLWYLGLDAKAELPSQPGQRVAMGPVRLADFASGAMRGSYFRYTGSLTAPPCTHDVTWFVVKTPISAPAAAVEDIERAIAGVTFPARGNYRATQPVGGRVVELVEPSAFV